MSFYESQRIQEINGPILLGRANGLIENIGQIFWESMATKRLMECLNFTLGS